jgi:pyridoxine 5-phosphate synthase
MARPVHQRPAQVFRDAERLQPHIRYAHARGVRVNLFMDPVPEAMCCQESGGADRVREPHAKAMQTTGLALKKQGLGPVAQTARAAAAINLGVNAGRYNQPCFLADFLRAVPSAKVGHALVTKCARTRLRRRGQDYLRCINRRSRPPPWR